MNWPSAFRWTGILIAATVAASLRSAEEVPTTIEAGNSDMEYTDTESTFNFRDGVTVTATNLKMTCDQLVIVARRAGKSDAMVTKEEQFKSLIATGNVRIIQNDRVATCERAEVLPGANKAILTGGRPKVQTLDGEYSDEGEIIELLRGEKRAIIRGGASGPTKFRGPALKDLGYDKEQENAPAPAQPAPATSTPATSESPTPAAPAGPTITVPVTPQK